MFNFKSFRLFQTLVQFSEKREKLSAQLDEIKQQFIFIWLNYSEFSNIASKAVNYSQMEHINPARN